MTHVERLHYLIDRIAVADADLAKTQIVMERVQSARQEAVDELHAILDGNEQPEQALEDGAEAAVSTDTPAPASNLVCPDCGFTGRTSAGLAVHRRRRHNVIGAYRDPRNGTDGLHPPVAHPSRAEKFLCASCSRPFLSRSARDAHQAEQNCAPVPTRPPIGPAPLGRLSGFGE